MKYAGYDAIVISGKAESPLYVVITDGKVEFRKASHLWGKTTFDAEQAIKAELGDREYQVRVIGPAGENKVLFANIATGHRFLGRGGSQGEEGT